MKWNDPVQSQGLSSRDCRAVGMVCLCLGGLLLMLGVGLASDGLGWGPAVASFFLGTVLIALGVGIDRDRHKQSAEVTQEKNNPGE